MKTYKVIIKIELEFKYNEDEIKSLELWKHQILNAINQTKTLDTNDLVYLIEREDVKNNLDIEITEATDETIETPDS